MGQACSGSAKEMLEAMFGAQSQFGEKVAVDIGQEDVEAGAPLIQNMDPSPVNSGSSGEDPEWEIIH